MLSLFSHRLAQGWYPVLELDEQVREGPCSYVVDMVRLDLRPPPSDGGWYNPVVTGSVEYDKATLLRVWCSVPYKYKIEIALN